MDRTQTALIAHLEDYNDQETPPFKTIKAYGGQIEKIKELIDPLPAAYVESLNNIPIAPTPIFKFDILVITKSEYYNKEEHLTANNVVVGNLCRWIGDNMAFSDDNHSYEIDADLLNVDPFQHGSTYTITAIEIVITKQ